MYRHSTASTAHVSTHDSKQITVEAGTRETDETAAPAPTRSKIFQFMHSAKSSIIKYSKFVGPGVMVSIAYMDPGNYSTDVAAGAELRYALLFVILLSNIIAMFLQTLAIKLGSVTGLNLASACRKHLPKWLTIALYILAEAAIIATDIAEVIGTAISLNILIKLPLIAGVCLTIVDVVLILLAYRPGRSMSVVRVFEYGISLLVLGVMICFILELTRLPKVPVGHIFKGFLPSREIFVSANGIYLDCGILGATVMPHSLYLGSELVKTRLHQYDVDTGRAEKSSSEDWLDKYKPSVEAIRYSMTTSIIELAVALSTVALFVNSSILIIAGAVLYGQPGADSADLYGIYDMLCQLLSKGAGVVFMVALLLSGQSAGIICTIAGQIVAEGHMHWTFKPWIRRIITRLIAILPCLVVAAAVGQSGINKTLNASQVCLSILLPFLTLPLLYMTCNKRIMTIETVDPITGLMSEKCYANSWLVTGCCVLVWLFIGMLNVYLIVHLGLDGS